jgi:hypothetical protein
MIVQIILIVSTRPHPKGLVDIVALDEGPLEDSRAVVFVIKTTTHSRTLIMIHSWKYIWNYYGDDLDFFRTRTNITADLITTPRITPYINPKITIPIIYPNIPANGELINSIEQSTIMPTGLNR